MARTTQDLSKQVMENLSLLEAHEDVSAEDHAKIARQYETKYAEMFFRELFYWPISEIDDMAFLSVARIMAEEVASAFSRPVPMEFSEGGQPVSMGTKGLMDLRRIVARHATGLPVRAVYY